MPNISPLTAAANLQMSTLPKQSTEMAVRSNLMTNEFATRGPPNTDVQLALDQIVRATEGQLHLRSQMRTPVSRSRPRRLRPNRPPLPLAPTVACALNDPRSMSMRSGSTTIGCERRWQIAADLSTEAWLLDRP